jgi:hypothetical protein
VSGLRRYVANGALANTFQPHPEGRFVLHADAQAELERVRAVLRDAKRDHDHDPANMYGPCNFLADPKLSCDCGAAEWNERVDAALKGCP